MRVIERDIVEVWTIANERKSLTGVCRFIGILTER